MSGNQPQLPSNILDALQIFSNTAWHNPSAFLRTHHSSTSRDVEYLHLQDHSVALQYLFGDALAWYNKILVRDEYREALQALRADHMYRRGAYIIGQPGIGRTSFLIYVLIERLREHKPVAVQLRAGDPFYAFFTHTCTLHSLSDPSPLVQPDVWALSDPRMSTTTPLEIFLDVSAKVVQAAPLSVKYGERWSRHRGAEMFVMNIWSIEEIADLSSLLELYIEFMTSLATKWGGVPRTLLRQYVHDQFQQTWELRRAAECAVENHTALYTLDALDVGTTSMIFFVLPLKDRVGNLCRFRYTVQVPTGALQNALAVALQQSQWKDRTDFFLCMFAHSETRSCARNIYANWFCSQVTSGRGSLCDWLFVQWDPERQRLSKELDRTVQTTDIPIIRDVTKIPESLTPCIWIGPSRELPGVDCAVFTNSAIFIFQASASSRPPLPTPKIDLDNLKKVLPVIWQNNQQVSYVLSYVSISNPPLINDPAYWVDKPSNVYVGTSAVDPMQIAIPYTAYTYGDDVSDEAYEG